MIVSELNLVSLFYKLNEIISAETDTKTTFEKIYQLSVQEWQFPMPGK